MIRTLKNALAALLLLAVVIFGVTNMAPVSVEIDPFGLGIEAFRPIEMPLAFVIFSVLLIGLILGVVLMRLVAWPVYRERREHKREAARLRTELAKLQERLKRDDHPASVALPAPKR